MTMVIKFLPVRAGLALVGYIEAVEDDLNLRISARETLHNASCLTSFSTTLVRVPAEFSRQVVRIADRRGVV
jgi:hypothetical protein